MPYSLLAHLFPRIKGSQEDVATYSLAYILEQSNDLNEAFTRFISKKLNISVGDKLSYRCQDADPEFGRPDIAGYKDGILSVLCEAKFFAGLTANQPVSYLKRLIGTENSGVVFVCPKERIVSLWGKVVNLAEDAGLQGVMIADRCIDYSGTRMSIVSWSEILSELIPVAEHKHPEMLGDLKQLEGFCNKVESETFIPFDDDDLSAQTATSIDRYYQVVDEVISILKTHEELSPDTAGLRIAPRWEGYSSYIRLGGKGISVDFIRKFWKSPTSVTTPFWFKIWDIADGKWTVAKDMTHFLATIDSKLLEKENNGTPYIALIPKPYLPLDDLAEDLANQIIEYLQKFIEFSATGS